MAHTRHMHESRVPTNIDTYNVTDNKISKRDSFRCNDRRAAWSEFVPRSIRESYTRPLSRVAPRVLREHSRENGAGWKLQGNERTILRTYIEPRGRGAHRGYRRSVLRRANHGLFRDPPFDACSRFTPTPVESQPLPSNWTRKRNDTGQDRSYRIHYA